MSTNTPDQQITLPVDADAADNPVAFTDFVADVENRLVRRYTDAADRTTRMVSLNENDLSSLGTENRVEVYNGSSHISLNTRALFAMLSKSANQTLTLSSTALQNVTDLVVAVPTAGTFAFRGVVYYESSAVADIKLAFNMPAAGTLRWNGLGPVVAGGTTGDATFSTVTAADGTISYGGGGAAAVLACQIEGEYVAGGTAGNLQLRAAQNTGEATNTIIHIRSRLEVWRLS